MNNLTLDEQGQSLRFGGSVWCNLDVALRNLDNVFGQQLRDLGLSVIEFYILRALYERDAQHASELARSVGRAATSFTPNLDKLQSKGLIERKPDARDRRAITIHLTQQGEAIRNDILQIAEKLDHYIASAINPRDFEVFLNVIRQLQTLPEYNILQR